MKLGPRPTGRPWTPAEDEQLLALLASGLDRPSIAQKLKRSVHAITSRERAFLEFFGRREANDAASQEEDRGTSTVNQVAEHPVSANPVKQTKTVEELTAMIHQDLSQIEGCPERGVKVTVYGLNPWNSMLTFGVDAGSAPNKTDLQSFCDIITERLRRLYDVGGPHVEG
jgi:hypothetical protein